MIQTRRDFLTTSAAGAAVAALSPYAAYAAMGQAAKPMRILILGGTGFLGPHCVEACLARGHKLTLFNRGRTETRTGHTWEDHPEIERLYGNRDPEKLRKEDEPEGPDNPMGLSALEGGEWDAVIDTSGYWPRIVGASASLLGPNVGQYLFVSTVSVYKSNTAVGDDTTAELGTMEDPTAEEFGDQFQNYGPGKALCEQAAEKAMPGRVTVHRPGLIVGPGDNSGRFTYWPTRVAKGGEVLSPGTPDDPIQLIDVRDLAAWSVDCLERKVTGIYDAIGPMAPELTMGDMLDACKETSGSDATFTWCNDAFLEAQSVSPWGHMPLWIPPRGESAGFHQRDVSKSIKAGLVLSPIARTTKDTLDWYNGLEDDSRFKRVGGIGAEKEAEVLAAWHAEHG
jgi:2'-hydroxyisoflavone reductase